MLFCRGFIALALPAATLAVYTWPSSVDELDNLLYLQTGYIRRGLIDAVSPCGFSLDSSHAQQEAANWVRTAFHDAITHNKTTGAGGLDASILFEISRDENPGLGFNSTFNFLGAFYNSMASMADLIALGAIVAIQSCGGPALPFRGGRIDAIEAGPPGVPGPTESTQLIQERFANSGFNVSDMISMVACGHSLGGVHGEDFPDVTSDTSASNRVTFETTPSQFDNKIVTEYLDNSTANPLVVGKNDTFNSDKRVFSSDGNVTMKAMLSPKSFQDTCRSILTRMIDTVPSNITLSEVMLPVELRPDAIQLSLNADKNLAFMGRVRVRTTMRNADALTVTLKYKPRSGEECANCIITTTRPLFRGGQSMGFNEVFTWFEFSTILQPQTSISEFNVIVTTKNATGTITETFDNNGLGFPVQDAILYQPLQSCQYGTTVSSPASWNLTVFAAVRNEYAAEQVRLDWVARIDRWAANKIAIPALQVQPTEMIKWTSINAGPYYTMFRGQRMLLPLQWNTNFDIALETSPYKVQFQPTSLLASACNISL